MKLEFDISAQLLPSHKDVLHSIFRLANNEETEKGLLNIEYSGRLRFGAEPIYRLEFV